MLICQHAPRGLYFVFSAFAGERGGPVHAPHVVVVNGSGGGGAGHVHILDAIANAKELLDTFIWCQYFCLARALCGLVLADGFLGDRSAGMADDKAGEGLKLESSSGVSSATAFPNGNPIMRH